MPKATRRKDGRFEAKITIGRKSDGSLDRKTVYAHSQKELNEKVSELRYKYAHNLVVKSPDMLMKDYCQKWFDTYKGSRGIATNNMYKNVIEKHIIPSIGHIPLKDVLYTDVKKMIDERCKHPRTCQQIMLTMRQISKDAIHDGLIIKDICYKVQAPSYRAKEKRMLTPLEKEAIVKADNLFTSREKAFVYCIYFFGLRREETLALTRTDFDFSVKTVTINKAIAFDANTPTQKEPKSFSGYREIPIPDQVIPFLKSYISSLDGFLLFTKMDGSPITKSSYDKMWASIVRKLNHAITTKSEQKLKITPITGLTAHIFRHNYATMLYYSNISIKKAAYLMGHSNTKLIMEVYSHLDEEKENVSEKINQAISL